MIKLNKLNYNKYDKNDKYDKKFYEDIISKYPKTDNKNIYDTKIYYEDYNKYLDDQENYDDNYEDYNKYLDDQENYDDNYEDENIILDDNNKNNYKIINLPLSNFYSKYDDEQSIRIFKAINQIMYTRSVKNYTNMAQSENLDLQQIRSLCLSTMATIEVILSEIKKIK